MKRREFLKQLALVPFAPLLPSVDMSPFAIPNTYEILSPSKIFSEAAGKGVIDGFTTGIKTSDNLGGFVVPDYLAEEIWKSVKDNAVIYKKVGITIE